MFMLGSVSVPFNTSMVALCIETVKFGILSNAFSLMFVILGGIYTLVSGVFAKVFDSIVVSWVGMSILVTMYQQMLLRQ